MTYPVMYVLFSLVILRNMIGHAQAKLLKLKKHGGNLAPKPLKILPNWQYFGKIES